MAAGALFKTPLRELTAFPHTHSWFQGRGGERWVETRKKEGKGGVWVQGGVGEEKDFVPRCGKVYSGAWAWVHKEVER